MAILLDAARPRFARGRLGLVAAVPARVFPYLAYVAVALSIVPLAQPILAPDVLIGHDAGAHQTYAFLFTRALWQGQVPVRWVEGVADGLGQPLFNHYQVGFYYLVALTDTLGLDLPTAFKVTIVSAWAAGAIFMFLLCRPHGTLPAAMAAAVFVWTPYLLVDGYVRTAYPELTAIGLTPGMLWAIDGLLRTGRRTYFVLLAFATTMLLITHLPTALIVSPLGAGLLVCSSCLHRPPPRRIWLAAIAAAVGAGIAAFYVLPAVLQMDAIHSASMRTDYFDYHRHFVKPEWWFDTSWGYAGSGEGAEEQMSMQLGIVQWIVIGTSLAVLAIPRLRRRFPVPIFAFAAPLTVVALALVMMTEVSAFVWEAIPPMAFIQFPWRLLMLPAIACGVLAAVLLSGIRQRTIQALLVVAVVGVQWAQTEPYREVASRRQRATVAIGDPGWPSSDSGRQWAFREPAYDPISVRVRNNPAEGRWTSDGHADISARSMTDAQLDLAVAAHEPIELTINAPFYPGWQTSIDGTPVLPSIDVASGYMTILVPAGIHRVVASFEKDLVRAVSELITLLSVIALIAFALIH